MEINFDTVQFDLHNNEIKFGHCVNKVIQMWMKLIIKQKLIIVNLNLVTGKLNFVNIYFSQNSFTFVIWYK